MHRFEFVSPHRLRRTQVPDPVLTSPTDALVEPVAATTCDLDRAIIAGHAPFHGPFAIGHEAVARVAEVGGEVRGLVPGQLVSVPWHVHCGTCPTCSIGRTAYCQTVPRHAMYGLPLGGDHGGLFSDLVRVQFAESALVALPDGVSARAAASASDNLTDAYRAVAQPLSVRPGADVLVVGGTGSLSVYVTMMALALGAGSVVLVEPDETCRAIGERCGAVVLDDVPSGRDFPVTVDASADQRLLRAALRATAPSGHCHSTGIYFQDVALPLDAMYMNGVTFTTGRPDVRPSIPEVLALLAAGRVDPTPVFSDVVPWDDAVDALAAPLRKPVVVRDGF